MAETGFIDGNTTNILSSDVLYGYNDKGRQNLNLKNSFYVQVTYEDGDGSHTVDAILTPNGNSWGLEQGGYTLTDFNGQDMYIPSVLYTTDDIKVYDVPPSEFGNAQAGRTPHINDGNGNYVSAADNSYITLTEVTSDIGNYSETRYNADGQQTGQALVDNRGNIVQGDLYRMSETATPETPDPAATPAPTNPGSTEQPPSVDAIQPPSPTPETTPAGADRGYYDSSMDYGEGATMTTSDPEPINSGRAQRTTTTITDANGNVLGTEECTRTGNYMEVVYKDANGNVVRRETYTNTSLADGKPTPSTTTNYEPIIADNGNDIVGSRETTIRSNGETVVTNRDLNGNITSTTTTTYTYNEDGTQVTGYKEVKRDGSGNITQTTVVKQENGIQIKEFYDGNGKITQRNTTIDGKSTTREYYTDGKLTKTEKTTIENGKTTTTTTEYKSDGKKVTTVEQEGNKQTITTKVYDENGKEVATTKVIEEKTEDGMIIRTTITKDGTVVEKIDPKTGEVVEKISEKGSLAKYATENPGNRGDGTLGSNLSTVYDSMQEIKGKITEHTELNHTATSNREAALIGAMYGATNFYGNVTDALYGKLSAEADAIYDIANTIYQMDEVLSSTSGLLASKDLSNDQGIFDRAKFSEQINALQAASDSLKAGTQEAIAQARLKYNDALDSLTKTFSTDGTSKPGIVSMDAIKSAVSAIVPALNEEVAKADGLLTSVDGFMSKIGGENMLKGGVWEDVATNMQNFENLLKLNKDAANELSTRIKTAMGWIESYMSKIGATEVDTDKLGDLKIELQRAKDHLAELEASKRMVDDYGTDPETGKSVKTGEHQEPPQSEIDAAAKLVEETEKKVTDIEGLIQIMNKAQEYIAECVEQINAAYADPVAYTEGNLNFESKVDIQPLIDSGLIDGSTDYSKLIDDYYAKIKAEEAEQQPPEETATSPEAGATEPKATEPDDDDDDNGPHDWGGGGSPDPEPTPKTEPKTETLTEAPTTPVTEPVTEAPTTPTTETPTEQPTNPGTETPTSGPENETQPGGGGTNKKPKPSGGTNKKPKDPNSETKPEEAEIIDTQDEILTDPGYVEPEIEDDYFEPSIDEEPVPIDLDPIEIPTETVPKQGNGLKTMGIAAGIGLAVGASALGAHTIMKSKEDDYEEDDYGYEK